MGVQDNSGSIVASYATGDVSGGNGNNNIVGGLVGWQKSGSITACYATGNADGGDNNIDNVGGLVGLQQLSGSITASYATGETDGRNGTNDRVGALIAVYQSGSITASYGFGSVVNGITNLGIDGSPPVSSADMLTETNVGAIWTNDTFPVGAWQFGSGTAPVLLYNDYDGSGSTYGCSGTPTILLPNCGM